MDHQTVDIATQRAGEILDRVKTVFAAKGFDGASMQDLAQAAQMSAGNFYRYFPSKNAIITALVERDLKEIEADFQAVHEASDPMAMFIAKLRERLETLDVCEAALWTEMQAASFRVSEIANLKRSMEDTVRRNVVETLGRLHGRDPSFETDFHARADLLMVMMHGFAQHRYCLRHLEDTARTQALAELIVKAIIGVLAAQPATLQSNG